MNTWHTPTSSHTPTASCQAESPQGFRLTPEQVLQFHTEGYLAPLTACSPEEMAGFGEYIDNVVLATNYTEAGMEHSSRDHNRHIDHRVMWELSTLPSIVGPMQSVLGEDLLMWRTNFFIKEPGGKEIPWHQDRNYWPLEPEIVISAWLAIDRADVENSCVQIVPGTHKKVIGHIPAAKDHVFNQQADTSGVDLTQARDIELEPGQFILFNERTLHHSNVNCSQRRRMGLAIRVIIPQVRVTQFDSAAHRLMQISGNDPLGFNKPHMQPPV